MSQEEQKPVRYQVLIDDDLVARLHMISRAFRMTTPSYVNARIREILDVEWDRAVEAMVNAKQPKEK